MTKSFLAERNAPLPSRVAHLLRQRLRREFAQGGRLPGEHQLAAQFGVSRGTIRQALTILDREGAVTRCHGSGTYANGQVLRIHARAEAAYEFTELIRDSGYRATITPLSVRREAAEEEVAEKLEIPSSSPVLVVRKLFLADARPAIFCKDVLPVALVAEGYEDIELEGQIFEFLQRRCRLDVKHVLASIVPRVAEGELVDLLGSRPGEALLQFDETGYGDDNRPILFSRIFYKDPIIRFTILRTKV